MNTRKLAVVTTAATALLATAFPATAAPPNPAPQPLYGAAVSPRTAEAGSTGNTLTVTYTAGDRPFRGIVRTVVPAGWSAPQTSSAASPGHVTLSLGSCFRGVLEGVTGSGPWTITMRDVTCRQGESFGITYANATAPTTAGANEFTTASQFTGAPTSSPVTSQPVVSVVAGPAATLTVAGHPATTTAGTANNFTVTGVDRYGNTNAPIDGTVTFTSSDAAATLPAPSAVPGGTATFGATLVTAGTQSITASRTADPTVTGTQAGITVQPGPLASIELSPGTATAPAGVAQPYTAEGFDAYDNSRGAVTPTLSIAPDGTCDATSCTATTAGPHTVTGSVDGISDTAALDVVNAAVASLAVTGFPVETTAGTPGNATVTAYDRFGNVARDYSGTVALGSSDPQASLPSPAALTNGTRTFAVELRTAGTQSITATDTAMPAVTGTQSDITVHPGPVARLELDPPTARLTAGNTVTFTADGFDAYGNGLGPQTPTYSVSPTGTCTGSTCEFRTPGTQTVTATVGSATGTATVTVDENTVTVAPASIADGLRGESYSTSFTTTGALGTVTFLDVYGELPPGLALASTGELTGTPTTEGVYTFTVRARDENGVVGTRTYTVTISSPVAISRTAVDFGDVAVTNSAVEQLTVTNNGSVPVTLSSRTTTNPTNFSAVNDGCFTLDPLAPGESCTSDVRYVPQDKATHTGRLTWQFSRDDGMSFSPGADLRGTGVSPLSISKASVPFGSVPVTGSATDTVTLTNIGNTPLVLSSRTTTNPSNFTAENDGCFTLEPLEPGETCTSDIRFSPQAEGLHTGRISWQFTPDGGGASADVGADLAGTGTPQLTIDVTSIDFGSVVETTSATRTVTVTNRGGSDVVLGSRTTTNPSNFSASNDGCFTLDPLAPGATCTSDVVFSPTAAGAQTGRVSWQFNRQPGGTSMSVGTDLTGTGTPQLTIDVTSIDFGSVVETTSATRTVTVTNRGGSDVVLGSRTTTNPSNFSASNDGCFTLDPLAPGATCTSDVVFSPTAAGAQTGRVSWQFNRQPGGTSMSVGADLAGTGTPQLTIDVTSIDFGSAPLTGSVTRTVTVTNNGAADVVLGSRTTTNPSNFAASNDGCFTLDPLTSGESCTSDIVFSPQAEGTHTGRLSWQFNRSPGGTSTTVGTDLVGTGVPQLTISQSSLAFGEVPVTGSATRTVTVTNVGSTDVVLGSRTTTNPSNFAATNDGCFTLDPLTPGETCTSEVTFSPQAEGLQSGRLSWQYTRQPGGTSITVGTDLGGTGTPQLGITRTSVRFGAVPVTSSATQSLTITNHGSAAVVLGSRTTTNPSNFSAVDDQCFTLDPLEPGESCTSAARFAPQDEGAQTGRLSWQFNRQPGGTSISVGADLAGLGTGQLGISVTSVDFGSVPATASATRSITLTNRGTSDVVLGSRTTTNPSNFAATNDGCFTLDPLTPGESCTSEVRFSPQAEGAQAGRVSWQYSRSPGGTALSAGADLSGVGLTQLDISVSSIPFGNMVVGGTITESVTVTNRGGTPVVLGSRTTTNPSNFAAINDGCFTLEPLEPGESCTSDVRFKPVAEGAHTGRVSWQYTRQSGGTSLSTGTDVSGIGSPQLGMSVSLVDFGEVPATASAIRRLSVTNHGDTAVVLGSRTTTNPSNFSAVDDGCFTLDPLEPGETCSSDVRFSPQAEGPQTGRLSWQFTRPSDNTSMSIGADLRGTGVSQLTISRTAIGFGDVLLGESLTVPVTITNRGSSAVVLGSRTTTNPSNFSAVDDGCFTLDPLEPGETCTSDVRFAPTTAGPQTGRVSWQYNRSPGGTSTSIGVDLSGTGL